MVDEASATSKRSSDWNESIGVGGVGGLAGKSGGFLEGEGIAANNKYSKDGKGLEGCEVQRNGLLGEIGGRCDEQRFYTREYQDNVRIRHSSE
jgi:hypothetical protein